MVLVTGSTGFVGKHTVKALLASGKKVKCLVRRTSPLEQLSGLDVEMSYGDINDIASLSAALMGVDTVVHLVAVIREKGGVTFERINYLGTKNVVAAAKKAGVKRIVHMSALGVKQEKRYPYHYTKWLGEQEVIESGIPYTILRSSLIFGAGDEFFSTLAAVMKVLPFAPVVGGGTTVFQPIWVEDVARCIALSVDSPSKIGRMIEIGGPEHITYEGMVDILRKVLSARRIKLHLPLSLMRPVVRLMELTLPYPPVTTVELTMLPMENATALDAVEAAFGFRPKPLEEVLGYVKTMTYGEALRITLGLRSGQRWQARLN